MRLFDWLDKILPGSAFQTTASHTDNIRQTYVTECLKNGLMSVEQARRELGIEMSEHIREQYVDVNEIRQQYGDEYMDPNICGEPYEGGATKSKCLWCTTPYEDDSGSCTKCGAPKDIEEENWETHIDNLIDNVRVSQELASCGKPHNPYEGMEMVACKHCGQENWISHTYPTPRSEWFCAECMGVMV